MWTSVEIIKIIVIPFVLLLLGYFFNRRLKQIDQINEDRHRKEIEAKEEERIRMERRYDFRIEFNLNATVVGMQKGFYLVEFIATINNKSLVRKQFNAIKLRIRGIKKNENIDFWTATINDKETQKPKTVKTKRLNFPEAIFKDSIIPPKWNYIFVEPGVKQDVTYLAPISEKISYILATVEFDYDATTPHTAEKILALQVPQSNAMITENQGVRHV